MAFSLKIRAHHLLCLQGFQGYGYDRRFTENMSAIIRRIDTDPGLELEVIAANDIICAYCPNSDGSGCRKSEDSDSNIRSLDRKVLEKLDYLPGRTEKVGKILAHIEKSFKTYEDIRNICGNCHWQEQCLWFRRFETERL